MSCGPPECFVRKMHNLGFGIRESQVLTFVSTSFDLYLCPNYHPKYNPNSHFTGGHEKALTALPMSEEQMENCRLTLLQKTAKSTCILKNTYILDKVMNARNKVCQNLYVGKEVLTVQFYSPLHQKGLITTFLLPFAPLLRQLTTEKDTNNHVI